MKQLRNTKYLKTTVDSNSLEPSFIEIAFVGRSNAGKSSVINAVCEQKGLAHTSKTPGKTRTINVFEIVSCRWLVDLPGYGFAARSGDERDSWQNMIEEYLTSRESLRMVYVIVDAFVGPTKLDKQMIMWLQASSIEFRIAANKADKLKSEAKKTRQEFISQELGIALEQVFLVSAKTGLGIQELGADMCKQLKIT
jgi:GTP-binding protein